MKRLGLLALLLTNTHAYAVNPVQGGYGGILLGFNYTPRTSFIFPTSFDYPVNPLKPPVKVPANAPATLGFGTMGQLAGQVGYRWGKYRVEGQLGYNNSPIKTIALKDFHTPGFTIPINNKNINIHSKASTNTLYGMVNAYYDFLPSEPDSSFAPFVGLGLGYAYTLHTVELEFLNHGVYDQIIAVKEKTTSPAGQIIIGGSIFMDDFTAFALDLRYFTTHTKATVSNANVKVISLNLTFNGAFNFG